MRNLLRTLPLGVEFYFVVMVAFGGPIMANLFALVYPPQAAPAGEPRLWLFVANELIVLGVLGLFLYARDWTPERLGLKASWMDPLWSVVLVAGVLIVVYAALYGLWQVAPSVLQPPGQGHVRTLAITPSSVAVMVLLNPLFEEVLLTGYVIAALKDFRGPIFAINVSVAIRLLYHVDQGVAGVLSAIPMGLIFGYWFARKGRIWPVVGAHAAKEVVALLLY